MSKMPSNLIEHINREKPLALYIFSKDEQQVQTILDNTTSGGTCVNDAISQVTCEIIKHEQPFTR